MGAIKVGFICQKSLSGTLTCAQVLDLMMNQPTLDETSHAHLHTADGFRIDPAKIVVNVLGLPVDTLKQQKQTEWGSYDSHLHPAGVASPVERFAPSDYAKKSLQERTSKVMQDQTRIAATNQYNERTGLGVLPGIPAGFAQRHYVKKLPPGRGKPQDIDIANPAAAGALNAIEYVTNANGTVRVFQGQGAQLTAAVPMVPAKSTHTMFEDSESMVMHLTASLLSKAGVSVLQTLKQKGHNSGKTVGVFSKTAVRAVNAHFQVVAHKKGVGAAAAQTLVRKSDTDAANPRLLTGTFTKSTTTIDHIVVVLSCSQQNDLIVVTCYPNPVSTLASIGTPTRDGQDIAEHEFGKHTVMEKQAILPSLVW